MKNNNKYNNFDNSNSYNDKVNNNTNKEKSSFSDKLEFISDILNLIFDVVDIFN